MRKFYIPEKYNTVIICDYFIEDYQGGAELTTEALLSRIETQTNNSVFRVKSREASEELIEKYKDKTWIIGNFSEIQKECLFALVRNNCNFHIIEYDYKFCQYRAPASHECECIHNDHGLLISNFYKRAKSIWFMSQDQMNIHDSYYGIKNIGNSHVLGSLWEESTLDYLFDLRSRRKDNGKYAILGGGSWIKNQEETEKYLANKNVEYDVVGDLDYSSFVQKLSNYTGLCFHPAAHDTCPRIVIEAKIFGLELDLNDYVQGMNEWFPVIEQGKNEIKKFMNDRVDKFIEVVFN